MSDPHLIKIIEKPGSVSWDEIHVILWEAHRKNREQGMSMRYPGLPGDELKKLFSEGGCCFVAMDGHKAVGTCSFVIRKRNTWYAKGEKVAHYILEGILPEYQGKGIYGQLMRFREEFVKSHGIRIVDMDTAEHNHRVTDMLRTRGYKFVGFRAYPYGKHYSVQMAKWLYGCPYSDLTCGIRYRWAKWKTKLRYKPGGRKRFGI